MIDAFIYVLPNGWHSLIDGRSFLKNKLVSKELAHQQCRNHVAMLIEQQDGSTPQHRTLAARRSLYYALATP
jgi:hypothetical protein